MGVTTASNAALLAPSGSSQNIPQRAALTDKKDFSQSRFHPSNMYAAPLRNDADAYGRSELAMPERSHLMGDNGSLDLLR